MKKLLILLSIILSSCSYEYSFKLHKDDEVILVGGNRRSPYVVVQNYETNELKVIYIKPKKNGR